MPTAIEREHKFLILNFDPLHIPQEAVRVLITQDYLRRNDPKVSRRVRKCECSGVVSYYYTEKSPTGIAGERVEAEHKISPDEYELFLQERLPNLLTLVKERATAMHGAHSLEFDSFIEPAYLHWLHLLEVEVEDLEASLSLPPHLVLKDVTHDMHFNNMAIASGSLRNKRLSLFLGH